MTVWRLLKTDRSARLADKTRKELHKVFEQFGLKITAEPNLHVVNFLDVTISYTGGSKKCNLCLEEKISILKEENNCLLNKRSEIVSACQHKSRINNLNKERNACYSITHAPTFPT